MKPEDIRLGDILNFYSSSGKYDWQGRVNRIDSTFIPHYNEFWHDLEVIALPETAPPTIHIDYAESWLHNGWKLELANCVHMYKTYLGIIETYEYCVKCDRKKDEKGR